LYDGVCMELEKIKNKNSQVRNELASSENETAELNNKVSYHRTSDICDIMFVLRTQRGPDTSQGIIQTNQSFLLHP